MEVAFNIGKDILVFSCYLLNHCLSVPNPTSYMLLWHFGGQNPANYNFALPVCSLLSSDKVTTGRIWKARERNDILFWSVTFGLPIRFSLWVSFEHHFVTLSIEIPYYKAIRSHLQFSPLTQINQPQHLAPPPQRPEFGPFFKPLV